MLIYLEDAIRTKYGSQKMAAKAMGINDGNLSKLINETKDPKHLRKPTIEKIESAFPEYNIKWLLYGTGNRIKIHDAYISRKELGRQESDPNYNDEPNKVNKPLGVPVYDVEFSAGAMASLSEARITAPVLAWLNLPEVKGCDAIIRAKGDSMADEINDRDYVGIKRIYDLDVIPPGHAYAIVTDDLELIKYLRKGSSSDTVLVRSHNKNYEDFELPINKIKELYAVRVVLPFSKIKTLI